MCSLSAGYITKRLMRREGAVCLGLFGSVSSRDLLPGTDERPMSNSPDMTASCCCSPSESMSVSSDLADCVQISGYNKISTMGYKNAEVQSALSGKAVILKENRGRNGKTTPEGSLTIGRRVKH